MEFKQLSKDLERQNIFKNIALKASELCITSFDSDEISEQEEKCLKNTSKSLNLIMNRTQLDVWTVKTPPPIPY